MTLRFKQFLADGIAQTSYLLGDGATAAVVDPRPDVDVYLDYARRFGLVITHIFETHIHADFMSGARELCARLDGSAALYISHEGGARYAFDHERLSPGNSFEFGSLVMEAVATPGHTSEHMSFVLSENGRDHPWGVLTGDSFFVDSVGRPDLLGDDKTEALSEALFNTLRNVYWPMNDDVIIYPCHGAGSECGPDIGDRLSSTIGYERRHNSYFRIDDLKTFRAAMTKDAPPVPSHYPRLKKTNASGPAVLGNLPKMPALTPERFESAASDAQILDTRHMLAFGSGHIEDALNIGGRPELSVWAGWLLDPDRPILLVLDSDSQLTEVVTLLWRVGYTDFAGYLAGGMDAWQMSGRPLASVAQLSVHDLHGADDLTPLDVRKDDEWQAGHIPGATHLFLGDLPRKLDTLDRDRAYATYCASGFRASAAASILKREGFDVRNVPGSFSAWSSAGYDIQT
jgi:hydroxyacylglutathione hydrolase